VTTESTPEPASVPRPPDGRRVVWAADWAPVEGAPLTIPGIVTSDLPDGWAYVYWADKDGWYSPDAVYETRFLREVSDAEFEERLGEVRRADWDGLVHDVPSPPVPSYQIGDRVRLTLLINGGSVWDPDAATWREAIVGGLRGLTRDHPGTIIAVAPDERVRVRWVDREGECDSPSFILPEALAPTDEVEAGRLTAELRSSGWPGLTVS
jgi:hypothetical protein